MKSFEHMTARSVAKQLRQSGAICGVGYLNYDCRRVALAYELCGDYEEEIKWLETPVDSNTISPRNRCDFARIDFKRGNKEEAFRKYCIFSFGSSNDSIESIKQMIEHYILMKETWYEGYPLEIQHLERLSPFRDYNEFLTFINAEYEALGRPVDQAEAVEWYRSMAEVMNAPEGGGEGGQGEATEVADQADAGDDNPGVAEGEAGEP